MQQVRAEFPNGEVEAYAVATDDEAEGIADYIEDTGLRSLVLLDTGPGGICHMTPDAFSSLYRWLDPRVGAQDNAAPFPLHVIIAPDGTFAYLDRGHDGDAVIDALRALVPSP